MNQVLNNMEKINFDDDVSVVNVVKNYPESIRVVCSVENVVDYVFNMFVHSGENRVSSVTLYSNRFYTIDQIIRKYRSYTNGYVDTITRREGFHTVRFKMNGRYVCFKVIDSNTCKTCRGISSDVILIDETCPMNKNFLYEAIIPFHLISSLGTYYVGRVNSTMSNL